MGTPADKAKGGTVQGEGDYEAARRFDRSERDFVKSGKVGERSGEAQPHDAAEASDMNKAEQAARAHSKGEAPGDLAGKNSRKKHNPQP